MLEYGNDFEQPAARFWARLALIVQPSRHRAGIGSQQPRDVGLVEIGLLYGAPKPLWEWLKCRFGCHLLCRVDCQV